MIPARNVRRFIRKAIEQPLYAVKVAYKRILANLFHDFTLGNAPAPEAVTIFLTHLCNLRCKMCGQWGDKGITKTAGKGLLKQELGFDELKKLVDELAKYKTNITLFGGEPFFHKDIIPLIRHIKSCGLHCLIITNGSLLKPHAEELVKAGLDELNLSLDGDEQMHDEIRGMKGLFNKITEGLNEVNKFKQKYNSKKPLINLQCTMSKFNYENLEKMIDVAESVKANSITFHQLIFLNEEIYCAQDEYMNKNLPGTGSLAWKGFIFEPELDVEKLISKINYIKSRKTSFFVNFYPNFNDDEIRDYYKNPNYLPKSYKARCMSPWIVSYVFPDGEVRPCLNIDYSFGNIQENNFKAVWNSEAAVKYRSVLKNNNLFPACIRCTELFRY